MPTYLVIYISDPLHSALRSWLLIILISFYKLLECTVTHVFLSSAVRTEGYMAKESLTTNGLLKQCVSHTGRDVTSVDGFGASL